LLSLKVTAFRRNLIREKQNKKVKKMGLEIFFDKKQEIRNALISERVEHEAAIQEIDKALLVVSESAS
jgi:hypothetical protein